MPVNIVAAFLLTLVVAFESFRHARELVRERSDHADTVFDLRVVAVVRSRGNATSGAQIDLIA